MDDFPFVSFLQWIAGIVFASILPYALFVIRPYKKKLQEEMQERILQLRKECSSAADSSATIHLILRVMTIVEDMRKKSWQVSFSYWSLFSTVLFAIGGCFFGLIKIQNVVILFSFVCFGSVVLTLVLIASVLYAYCMNHGRDDDR